MGVSVEQRAHARVQLLLSGLPRQRVPVADPHLDRIRADRLSPADRQLLEEQLRGVRVVVDRLHVLGVGRGLLAVEALHREAVGQVQREVHVVGDGLHEAVEAVGTEDAIDHGLGAQVDVRALALLGQHVQDLVVELAADPHARDPDPLLLERAADLGDRVVIDVAGVQQRVGQHHHPPVAPVGVEVRACDVVGRAEPQIEIGGPLRRHALQRLREQARIVPAHDVVLQGHAGAIVEQDHVEPIAPL